MRRTCMQTKCKIQLINFEKFIICMTENNLFDFVILFMKSENLLILTIKIMKIL